MSQNLLTKRETLSLKNLDGGQAIRGMRVFNSPVMKAQSIQRFITATARMGEPVPARIFKGSPT